MLDLWLQAETPGVTHFGAYHRPPDGHFWVNTGEKQTHHSHCWVNTGEKQTHRSHWRCSLVLLRRLSQDCKLWSPLLLQPFSQMYSAPAAQHLHLCILFSFCATKCIFNDQANPLIFLSFLVFVDWKLRKSSLNAQTRCLDVGFVEYKGRGDLVAENILPLQWGRGSPSKALKAPHRLWSLA